jgi:hypothetical protein
MRDWRQLVPQRLAGLEDGESAQVVEELATHLEEKYQVLLKHGVSEELAVPRALDLAGDWKEHHTRRRPKFHICLDLVLRSSATCRWLARAASAFTSSNAGRESDQLRSV